MEPRIETKARRRSLKHLASLQNNASIREEARKAVAQAAQQALQQACLPRNIYERWNASVCHSLSNEESKDEVPSRDTCIALDELLSFPQTLDPDSISEKDDQKNPRKWSILKKFRPPRFKNPNLSLTSEISTEAWMCGVCAKSFSSFHAAQRHEDFHIREVIEDLGFAIYGNDSSPSGIQLEQSSNHSNNDRVRSNSDRNPKTPERATSTAEPETPQHASTKVSFRTPSSKQPRPDVLRMSSPSLRYSVGRSLPHNTPALQRKRKTILNSSQDLEDSFSNSHGEFYYGDPDYDVTTTVLRPSAPMSPIDEQGQYCRDLTLRDPGRKNNAPTTTTTNLQGSSEWNNEEHGLMVPHGMRDFVVLADEGLVNVCEKAKEWILTPAEQDAELELEYLAQDKAYYDMMSTRATERQQRGRYSQFRTEGKSMLSKVQNKFVDAYQLMKEGNSKRKTMNMDHYTRKLKGDIDTGRILENSKKTLYVNVIVKASLEVVTYELQRLAKQRWEAAHANNRDKDPQTQRFQQFRALAQNNLVKLAGMALASDFTPRRIAIQLSNDLYRLLTPRLKRRGVSIETEIEYRVGPYFVLGVNFQKVDWKRLVRAAHRDVAETNSTWRRERLEEDGENRERPRGVVMSFFQICYDLSKLTKFEVLAQVLAWCYYLHWTFYTPFFFVLYHSIMGELFRNYFLATVSDEIFFYVEEKGMEMDIGIRNASTQAAFMLSALREIRADGKESKKKKQSGEETDNILGPLLGPAFKEDKSGPPSQPAGFQMPETLEFIGLELELPVGYRRLRWALLSSKSSFLVEAVFKAESKYDNITIGSWSKHNEEIGLGTLPDGVTEADIIGSEKEISYLMPKSAFVKANMCYETSFIDMYDDYCFVVRKKTLTPEVPYGSTFVAWTKYVVINTGNDSCKLICSVEAEFPNGPPMISRQIKNGMRAGVGELFVKIGETINKYADHFP